MLVPQLSIDALIIAATGLTILYGVLSGYLPLVRLGVSAYVGLVLATTFAKPLYDMSFTSGKYRISLTAVQLVLLALPVVVLQIGHPWRSHAHKASLIGVLILAIITSLLMTSTVLGLLDSPTRSHILDQSNLAAWIYNLRLWWLGLEPAAIALAAVLKPKPR